MKTNLLCIGTSCLLILTAAHAVPAYADGGVKDKTCSGTVSAVNSNDKLLTVHSFLSTKTFALGENCALSAGGKTDLTLADFRPGQKVNVTYKDVNGVLVAGRITREKLVFDGVVSFLDQHGRRLTVRHGGTTKTFLLADDCNVVLNGNGQGRLEDVKPGQRVTIVYEVPLKELLARTIEQKSAEYVGSLSVINLPDRMVSADKRFLGAKSFHLADDCVIVRDGKLDGRMNDLRIGRNYELSYDTVDGVNIVNRIAPAPGAENTRAASTSPQMKDY